MAKKGLVILIALALLTLPSTHGAAIEGGKDVNPEGDDIPFSVVDRDSPSVDKVKWSLAIEMQFYLVWPIFLVLILSLKRRIRNLF